MCYSYNVGNNGGVKLVNFRDRAAMQKFIIKHHFTLGKSLRAIEQELGVGKTVVQSWCRRHKITTRSQREASGKAMKESQAKGMMRGKNHWAYGMTKETSPVHAKHSKRMTTHNPTHLPGAMERILKFARRDQLAKPPIGEQLLSKVLDSFNKIKALFEAGGLKWS